jgi:hypothetical protein
MASVAASLIATGDQLFDLVAFHPGKLSSRRTIPIGPAPGTVQGSPLSSIFKLENTLCGCDRDVGDLSKAGAERLIA